MLDAEGLALAPGESWDLEEFLYTSGPKRAALRRSVENDRYGLMAYVLSARDRCQPAQCAAYRSLTDHNQIAANMDERTYEGLIVRYSASWNAPSAPAFLLHLDRMPCFRIQGDHPVSGRHKNDSLIRAIGAGPPGQPASCPFARSKLTARTFIHLIHPKNLTRAGVQSHHGARATGCRLDIARGFGHLFPLESSECGGYPLGPSSELGSRGAPVLISEYPGRTIEKLPAGANSSA